MRPNSHSPGESCLRISRFRKLFGTDVRIPAFASANLTRRLCVPVLGVCLLALPALGLAQQFSDSGSAPTGSALSALPDTPDAAQSSGSQSGAPQSSSSQPSPAQTNADQRLPQTKRILGIVPNFRAVSTDEKLPPQTVKEKFMDATQDSFDYSSIIIPAVIAGYSMATNQYPEFHQGAAGYVRYFWHSAVDQTSENYMVEFIVPVITREDTRYYTLGRGGFVKRTGYALSRVVVTRTDAGNESINLSEIVGAGAASGLSSLYYPTRERSFGNTASEWGLDLGIDGLSFMAREFWPDINRRLFHGKGSVDPVER
jgi:hypothetical protein